MLHCPKCTAEIGTTCACEYVQKINGIFNEAQKRSVATEISCNNDHVFENGNKTRRYFSEAARNCSPYKDIINQIKDRDSIRKQHNYNLTPVYALVIGLLGMY